MAQTEQDFACIESLKSILKKKKSIRIPPSTIGKISSIGDVGTIRGKLHQRRTQLNKEIIVENRIKQGSRKLAKLSSNDRTRDLAKLELEFSKSKIHVLQTELARINSSIQAYQPKSVRATQVPLIPIALKTTSRMDYCTILSGIIQEHYYVDPIKLQESIDQIQTTRESMATPPKDQSGIDLLYEYFSYLIIIIKRFLHPSLLSKDFTINWHDAINGLPAAQKSTAYEKACVIFNIGALHTQIAAQQDRSTLDGIDEAITQLEQSLGVFEYMKHNFSHSPTLDMTTEILSLLSDLMRAQVVEVQWERTLLEQKEHSIATLIEYSQRNKLIAECYKPVRDLVEDVSLKDYLPSCWSALIKIKDAHFRSQAHYYASVIHERLGIEISNTNDKEMLALRRASLDTELHFMYTAETTNTTELFSSDIRVQMGIAKSHLNCASLSHEYSLRYKEMSKELEPVEVIQILLEKANKATQTQKEAITEYESTAMIAPTIQPADIDIHPVVPNFTRMKVTDIFQSLGPLPYFCAENVWSKPRTVSLIMEEKTYGFSIKGSKPAKISGVDDGTPAKEQGLIVGDWLLSINGNDIRYSFHSDIVKLVQEAAGGELILQLTTPTYINRKLSTPCSPLPSPSVSSIPDDPPS